MDEKNIWPKSSLVITIEEPLSWDTQRTDNMLLLTIAAENKRSSLGVGLENMKRSGVMK